MAAVKLTVEQEAEAQELAKRIHEQTEAEILALARLLVSKRTTEIFGETEFEARDIVHRIGAKALEVQLAQKKTATRAAASSVLTASKRPSSKATGRKVP